MNKWKKVGLALLFPNRLLIFFLVNVSAVLLVYAFCGKDCPQALAYASYTLSAYALTVVCARIPKIIKKLKKGLYHNKYTNLYLTERELRVRISLYIGFIFNICFAVFKVVMGVLYQSAWLFAIAGYNTILSGMRLVLVYRDMADKKVESIEEKRIRGLHSYKVCGWLMLLLNIAISVIVLMVVMDNQPIRYPGYMIYAIAAYTFYYLVKAIRNIIIYWQRYNPVFSAVKRVELAKAFVSLFTMQVAMLTQFGENGGINYQMANAVTGIAVCIIINTVAALMLAGVRKTY